jgi:16S rRNA (cytidine1402-2'-O)-methyltransferase
LSSESHKPGRLYIVGTPIGNLEDITLRAVRILKEADLIAAEDTRVCRKLLSRYEISTPVTSFHEHSSTEKQRRLLSELASGKVIALVSDAGMPAISDPGEKLVAAAIAEGIEVIPIPGPSAVITALAVSGLPTAEFTFIGFLPRRQKERQRTLGELAALTHTLVFYEAPHRLVATLEDLFKILGNRRAVAARELTKKFEQIVRGELREIIEHFKANPPRGEITIVVKGLAKPASVEKQSSRSEIPPAALSSAKAMIKQGISAKDAAREIAAATGVSRRLLYNALQR